METERKIRTYGGYFEKFMETLNEKEQEKYNMDCFYSKHKKDYPLNL